eukprot:763902_1
MNAEDEEQGLAHNVVIDAEEQKAEDPPTRKASYQLLRHIRCKTKFLSHKLKKPLIQDIILSNGKKSSNARRLSSLAAAIESVNNDFKLNQRICNIVHPDFLTEEETEALRKLEVESSDKLYNHNGKKQIIVFLSRHGENRKRHLNR